MALLRHLIRAPARSTNGCRLYAIGDVHGCFDQLVRLLQLIESDQALRKPAETHVILLGDYIDRGPQSRDVCELLYAMRDSTYFHCLRGNHEQTMLDVLEGSRMALQFWLKYGGGETLLSWGVDPEWIEAAHGSERMRAELIGMMQEMVPEALVDWMRGLPTHYLHGDYLFVHAGVRPRVPLAAQKEEDMLWIRQPFLSSRARHPWRVVHGHSEGEDVQISPYRIGIDTAAYRTGVLTAIGLEDNDHWLIQTIAD